MSRYIETVKLSQLIISKLNFRGSVEFPEIYYADRPPPPFSNPARAPLCFSLFSPTAGTRRGRGGEGGREPECLYHNFMLYGFLRDRRS